jgi:[acyl-carrier-protein] S-malonyltransferase
MLVTTGLAAILCSGQGEQHAGMFDLVGDCPAAEPVFGAAASVLGCDPRRLVREDGPALFQGKAAQILCCTQALATWLALEDTLSARAIIAGYSVGEIASWACAGALDVDASFFALVARRAAAMEAASPPNHGLAGITGLSRTILEPMARSRGGYIAIVNDEDSFVVGASASALEEIRAMAAARGARRAVRLRVTVPSHTPFLAAAVDVFRSALDDAAPRPPKPGYRLLSGIDGETVFDLKSGCDKLARQIATEVNWAACLASCQAAGAVRVLELGPGRALSRMAARLFPEGAVRASEDFRTVTGLRAWLARRD